jgi:hypothetical protein
MTTFKDCYHPLPGTHPELLPLLESLYQCLTRSEVVLLEIRTSTVAVLEYLASSGGRTDANCRAVDLFLTLMEDWRTKPLPETYLDILSDMSGALHDTVSAPEVASNFESTPEQLLERARRL